MKRFRQILESVDPIMEAIAASANELAKEIDAAARRETGQDKKDYMNVAKLIAANKYKEAAKFMSKLDTMPLEDLVVLIMGHEDVFKVMYPKARPGQFVANFARESVDEALEFHVRLDRLDRDKRLLDKVKDLLKKHERAGHISFEYETDKGVVFTAKSKSYIDAVRKDVETKPYYALVDFSESVELDEAFKKGDSVTVKNARKYDSLSKPEVSGTVIGMIGSKVMVKVGSGQMNVDAKDLDKVVANESVELDEGALGKQWQNGAKMVKSGSITLVKAKNPDADLHTVMKNGKKVGTFVFDDGPDAFSVTNMSTKKVSWADQIDDIPKMFESKAPALKSSDYPKGTSQSAQAFKDKFAKNKKESVELDESRDEALKALEDLVKKGGIDKADFQKAHTLYKVNKLNDLRKHISSLDTDPAEAIVRAFSRRDPNAFKSMYPRAKAGDYFANIIGNHKESVELGEAFTPKDIKMAIGIASDKRYAGGNMTGAVNAIEKIKKGLSNHSQVKAVLKRQNESLDASTINEAGSSERLALIKKAVQKVRARNAALEKKAAAAAKRDMKAKGAQRGMAPLKKDDLDEAKGSKYDVYHKDFSTAVQYARKEVEKQGYKIDDEEWFRKVGSGPRKPSVGKTNQYNIDLMKNDKDVKQKLHMQVYGMDNGKYELNMYVS